MLPVRTPQTNLLLQLPGGTEDNDLPAERITIEHPDHDEAQPGIETRWLPDATERARLAAGGQLILRVWGQQHPPVSIGVDLVADDAQVPLIGADHADRALQLMFMRLVQDLEADQPQVELHAGDRQLTLGRPGWRAMFEDCLRETANMDTEDRELDDTPPPAAPLNLHNPDVGPACVCGHREGWHAAADEHGDETAGECFATANPLDQDSEARQCACSGFRDAELEYDAMDEAERAAHHERQRNESPADEGPDHQGLADG